LHSLQTAFPFTADLYAQGVGLPTALNSTIFGTVNLKPTVQWRATRKHNICTNKRLARLCKHVVA